MKARTTKRRYAPSVDSEGVIDGTVFINVPEAAELLRLSDISIRRYLTKKMLTRYKVFGRTLLKREEVMALVRRA